MQVISVPKDKVTGEKTSKGTCFVPVRVAIVDNEEILEIYKLLNPEDKIDYVFTNESLPLSLNHYLYEELNKEQSTLICESCVDRGMLKDLYERKPNGGFVGGY